MRRLISLFYKAIDMLTYWFLFLAFTAIVCILSVQVFSRFVFSLPFMWAEEFSRYLFIWITYIGGAVAFSKGGHLVVDVFINKFPIRLKFVLEVIFSLVMIAFAAYVAFYGLQYSAINYTKPFYSTKALNLGVAYLAIPIGCGLMVLNILRNLAQMLNQGTAYFQKEKEGVF